MRANSANQNSNYSNATCFTPQGTSHNDTRLTGRVSASTSMTGDRRRPDLKSFSQHLHVEAKTEAAHRQPAAVPLACGTTAMMQQDECSRIARSERCSEVSRQFTIVLSCLDTNKFSFWNARSCVESSLGYLAAAFIAWSSDVHLANNVLCECLSPIPHGPSLL